MNKQDRKELAEALTALTALEEPLETLHGKIDDLASAEESKFDNMSEGLQQGEKGQAIEQAKDALQEAAQQLETAKDALIEAISILEGIE